MSPLGIASTLFSLFQSGQTGSATSTQARTSSADSGDFSSSLAVRMASLQAQSVNMLLGSIPGNSKTSNTFDFLTGNSGTQSASSDLMSLLG